MQAFNLFFVLLIAFSSVLAQYPATLENKPSSIDTGYVVRNNLAISDNYLTNQQLPPCYTVDYKLNIANLYSTSGTTITANVFLLEFLPQTNTNIPYPSKFVTFELMVNGSVIKPTSQFTSTINGTNYGGCTINTNGSITTTGSNNCAINYYCSSLPQYAGSNVPIVVRISTEFDEQLSGILFDLRLDQRLLPVQIISPGQVYKTLNVPTPVIGNTNPVDQYFPPLGQQYYYHVAFAPSGTSRLSIAQYIATSSNLVGISFKLFNVTSGGSNITSNGASWTLGINEKDFIFLNTIVSTPEMTNVDCGISNSSNSLLTNQTIEIVLPACQNMNTDYYISVLLPTSNLTGWGYSLLVSYIGNKYNKLSTYIPTFTQITSNNTLISSIVGDGLHNDYYLDPYKQDNYWLNIPSSAPDNYTYVWVTIFGIAPNTIFAEITEGNLGYLEACTNNVIDFCAYHGQPSRGSQPSDGVIDFCKMQIPSCQYSSTAYYFISVSGQSQDHKGYYTDPSHYYGQYFKQLASSYSILFQLFTINVVSVPKLTATTENGFNVYTDINSVSPLGYKHYVFNIDPSTINEYSYLVATLYYNFVSDHNYLTLYTNYGNLAGSTQSAGPSYSPDDFCYGSTRQCSPNGDFGACSLVFRYCEINSLYFSVYGEMIYYNGYNASISYTLKFSYRNTPELLFDRVTNIQHLLNSNNFYQTEYSHQFSFQVPHSASSSVVTAVAFRMHGYQVKSKTINGGGCEHPDTLTIYVQCDSPTGSCPCYVYDQLCSISSASDEYCQIYSNLCDCPSGNYYVSVQISGDCDRPYTYQITPYTITASVNDEIHTSDLVPSVDVSYTDTFFQAIPDELFGYEFDTLLYYYFFYYTSINQHIYRVVNDNGSTNDALSVDVAYNHFENFDVTEFIPIQISREVVAFDNACTVQFCSGKDSTNMTKTSSDYYQPEIPTSKKPGSVPDALYCSVIVQPCWFTQDTYYIRLMSWEVNDLKAKGHAAVTRQTIDYTLRIRLLDYTPVSLQLNTPVHMYQRIQEYNHFVVPRASIAQDSWIRISAYMNEISRKFAALSINYGAPAGYDHYSFNYGCYTNVAQCRFGGEYSSNDFNEYYSASINLGFSPSQYCDFFLDACDIPNEDIYVSITNPMRIGVYSELEYTLVVESQGVNILNVQAGYPTTGLLLYDQAAYYSYTINPTDQRTLVIQIQSIEPYPELYNEPVLEAFFSFQSPSTISNSTCDCNGSFKYNGFSTLTYNCNNLVAGPYYITVRSTLESFYAPVSYTIRAFYREKFNGTTINIQRGISYTQVVWQKEPQVLNYQQSIDYSFTLTSSDASDVLYIGIADVSYDDTTNTDYYRALNAYVKFGSPANPQCYDYSVFIHNTVTQNPNGQMMYAFQIPPCNQCTGTYYVSIYANLLEPEPLPQYQLSFSIAVWTTGYVIPTGFSTSFLTQATGASGYNFVFSQNDTIYCDSRYTPSPFFIDFHFQTLQLQTNLYELLITSYQTPSFSDTSYYINGGSYADRYCLDSCMVSGSQNCDYGCNTSLNQIYYGSFGFVTCTSNQTQQVNGNSINFQVKNDQIYTVSSSTINVGFNSTNQVVISPRQIVYFNINLGNNALSIWPTIQFIASASTNCFNVGSTGITFPLGTYCAQTCVQAPSSNFDTCCLDPTDVFTISVYNTDTSNSITATVGTNIVYYYASSTQNTISLSNSAIAVNVPPNSNFNPVYQFYSFNLTSSNWAPDSVLNIIFNSSNTVNFYLNYASHAGDNAVNSCFNNTYHCQSNCLVQLPQCAPDQFGYGLGGYYLAISSIQTSSTTATLVINSQSVVNMTSNSITSTVPTLAGASTSFYTHIKFLIVRSIGDIGLAYQNVLYQVELSTSSGQTLQLNIHQSLSGFPLAGDQTNAGTPYSSCSYTHDKAWTCSGGRVTNSSGIVTCTTPLCNGIAANSYINTLPAGAYMYASVRNTQSNTQASFTLTTSLVSDPQPSNIAVFQSTPINVQSDGIINTTCSITGSNNGGCHYTQGTSGVNTLYFNVMITPSNWKTLDYLLVNFTNIQGSAITFTIWPADECEPDSSVDRTCDIGATDCFYDYSPSSFTSFFYSNNGVGTRTPLYNRNYWVRISFVSNSDFYIQIRQVTSTSVTIPLSSTVSYYSAAWVMWSERYLLYNIQTPSTYDYSLDISATVNCIDFTTTPVIYYNIDNYRWASDSVYEYKNNLPVQFSLAACDIVSGGNNYFTIYTPYGSIYKDETGTLVNEGILAAQIQITFTAQLSYVSTINAAWDCTQSVLTGDTTYILLADGENPGTEIEFDFTNCNNCVVKVVTPLYREVFMSIADHNSSVGGPDIYSPQASSTYDYNYIQNNCDQGSCSDTGVYCLTNTATARVIRLDPCLFRNGRYFVQISSPSSHSFTTSLSRKDYTLITPILASPVVQIYDTLTPGYYKYYQVIVQRSDAFFVKITLTPLVSSYNHMSMYVQYGSNMNHENTANFQPSCHSNNPNYTNNPHDSLFFVDHLCGNFDTKLVYYVGVYIDGNSVQPLAYQLDVNIRSPNFELISDGTYKCGSILSYDFQVPDRYVSKNLVATRIFPQNTYYYQLDTSSLNLLFASVDVYVAKLGLNPLIKVDSYFGNYATTSCSACSLLDIPQAASAESGSHGHLTCGISSNFFVIVTMNGHDTGSEDYQLMVSVTQRPVVSLSPGSGSVGYTQSTVFSFNNQAGNIVILAPVNNRITAGDTTVSTSCSDGCAAVDTGCVYLSQPITYYFIQDFIPQYNKSCGAIQSIPQNFGLTTYNQIVLNDQVLYTITSGTVQFYTRTFTATELASYDSFRVRVSNINNNAYIEFYLGCNGAATSNACSYYQTEFSTSSSLVSEWVSLGCGSCQKLFIVVKAPYTTCEYGPDPQFQITVDFTYGSLPVSGVALTSAWQASGIEKYADSTLANYWSVTSSSDGFLHVGIGNVNGTGYPSNEFYGHTLLLTVYLNNCPIASCETGQLLSEIPQRKANYDMSCFVNFATAGSGISYLAVVSVPSGVSIDFEYSAAFYRAQSYNSFTDLSTTGNNVFTLQGRARHYYKIASSSNGSPISVKISLNILSGPRIIMQAASTSDFMTNYANSNVSYPYWNVYKVCPFGMCTIELPTLASHPGSDFIYVWVSTAPTNGDTDFRTGFEKPTNYQISATTGLKNCGSLSNILSSSAFCNGVSTSNNNNGFWILRDGVDADHEASCLYNNIIPTCPSPSAACLSAFKRFACLETFRQCDTSGFWVPKCRSECLTVTQVCGQFYEIYGSNLATIFNCGSANYLDSEPCTGDISSQFNTSGLIYNNQDIFGTGLLLPGNGPNAYGGPNGPYENPLYFPSPSPSAIPLTPDQPSPPAPLSNSHDCLPTSSPSINPRTTTFTTTPIFTNTPTISTFISPPPKPSSSNVTVPSLLVLLCIALAFIMLNN